jgi:4-amino-4-deoxy-L-arabinose transferase-like glycosyltransferase
MAHDRASLWSDLAVLALVLGVLYFLELGDSGLVNPDEGRYAEIPREMVASDDYVTPRLNNVLYFEKPPLVYWIVAGLLRVFGPSELAMRATPAFFGLLGVLVLYLVARRMHGRMAGLASAAVLGTSLLYFALGRILLLDMVVSVLMSSTLFCFILGVREPPGKTRRLFFYGLYATAALATLAKGLIGFLLTGAVMFTWLAIFNQWRRLVPLYLPTGVLLFLAIAAPWHVLVAQRNPQWTHFYFVQEHWQRFTTTYHGRTEPFWFFGPVLLLGLFPWMGFLWPAVRSALVGGPAAALDAPATTGLRGAWTRRKENADAWFFVTWAAFVFLFFSKSQSKLIPYILPVFPPLALLIGKWLSEAWRDNAAQRLRGGMTVFALSAGMLGGALLMPFLKPGLIPTSSQVSGILPDAVVASAALLVGGTIALWSCRRGSLRTSLVAVAAASVALYFALADGQDKLSRPGTKSLALHVKEHRKPGDRVYHYYQYFHDFSFYAESEVGTVAYAGELELQIDSQARASGRFIDEPEFRRQWDSPTRLWVVARKRDIGPLFADKAFRYHLIRETSGHYLFSNQP